MRLATNAAGKSDPLLKRIDKLTGVIEEVVEAIGEMKPAQITVQPAKIDFPKSEPVKLEPPQKPKSATIVSTRPDGTRTTHEITFNYSTP